MRYTTSIVQLVELLTIRRETLTHLLEQSTLFDRNLVPPEMAHSIKTIRDEIAQLKQELSRLGGDVEDAPIDYEGYLVVPQPLKLPIDYVPEPLPLPPRSYMPLKPNPLFVGREAELKQIAKALQEGTTSVIAAATGMGGIGKTQLASEFVHRYGYFFLGGVFWLSFADADSVEAEIAACGQYLNIPNYREMKVPDLVAHVQQCWQEPTPRLLVFDNCEDEDLLLKYRPSSGGSRVLVTSRRQWWDSSIGLYELRLDELPREQSVGLLRKFRPDLSSDDPDLNMLAATLGDLPLALHVAGSYLKRYEVSVSPAQYLQKLRSAPLQEFALRGLKKAPTGHELDLILTLAASYERLESNDPTNLLAKEILAHIAHFAFGEPILRRFIFQAVEKLLPEEEPDLFFEDALIRLAELGLLERESKDTIRLHRLIAAFVLKHNNVLSAQKTVEQILIDEANHLLHTGYPIQLQSISTHLRHAQQQADERSDLLAADLAHALGSTEHRLINYATARPLFKRALELYEQLLGTEHEHAVTCLANLADLLRDQSEYQEAQRLFETVLPVYERLLGPKHLTVANSLMNLAFLIKDQGAYPHAQSLLERALAIYEQVLGPRHRTVANCLTQLAFLIKDQGDYEGARPLFERALAINEEILGPNHFTTTMSLSNLAFLIKDQGDYEGARPLFERALAINEQTLGPHHPQTATSLTSLAFLIKDQGDYEGARPLFERALAINEQTLGPHHPQTVTSLNSLAFLIKDQGDYEGARPLFERALTISEEAFGPYHPQTATNLTSLAFLIKDQGDYEGARPLFERALAIHERVFGSYHPHTATSLTSLAFLLKRQRDYEAAQPLFQRALDIRKRALGDKHPHTAQSLSNLAVLLMDRGNYQPAKLLFERALSIGEEVLGPTHLDTAIWLNNLARLLRRLGEYSRARLLFERTIAIREERLGVNHPYTAIALTNFALLFEDMGDHQNAHALVDRAYTIYLQAFSDPKKSVVTKVSDLINLLDQQGDYQAARLLYQFGDTLSGQRKCFQSSTSPLMKLLQQKLRDYLDTRIARQITNKSS
jgi:Tfp pilus assembly protein PilF